LTKHDYTSHITEGRIAAWSAAVAPLTAYLGASLPPESVALFDKIRDMSRSIPPVGPFAVVAARDNPRWNNAQEFADRCFDGVQLGLSATWYNLETFLGLCAWIEQQVPFVIATLKILNNSTVISPACHKLIFEYEHFTFHLRATLDRVAHLMCYFFKTQSRNFRTLYQELKDRPRPQSPEYPFAQKLIASYERYAHFIEPVHSKDHGNPNEWTERDIIAHKGFIHLTQVGIQTWPNGMYDVHLVAFKGEELLHFKTDELLTSRYNDLQSFLIDLLTAFFGISLFGLLT